MTLTVGHLVYTILLMKVTVMLSVNLLLEANWAFPGGSVGKESACYAGDAGDMGSIPGLGRSLGGGHGNPLRYSCWTMPRTQGAW